MTRLIEPRAIYREAVSMETETDPSIRSLLAGLQIPRWYLMGELSGPEPEFEREMAAIGVGWTVIPNAGHPMALQNPEGVAQAIADVLPAGLVGLDRGAQRRVAGANRHRRSRCASTSGTIELTSANVSKWPLSPTTRTGTPSALAVPSSSSGSSPPPQ